MECSAVVLMAAAEMHAKEIEVDHSQQMAFKSALYLGERVAVMRNTREFIRRLHYSAHGLTVFYDNVVQLI